jgi:hypothetical protein
LPDNRRIECTLNPNQKIGGSTRVGKIRCDHPRRQAGHELTVPASAGKAAITGAFYHLFLVALVSGEIPATGCDFIEGVQILTPEPPSPADDPALYFSALEVSSHRAWAKTQHFGCLFECQQAVADTGRD